jgi:hypothetical protein
MHYTALHNYSAVAGIPPAPAQRAPAMSAFTAISAASGELMVPENAGVVIQAKSGINAIRVSGTATTSAGVTGTGTTSNQIQFYSNDTIVGAFDQNGLYFPDAKSNILSIGSLGSILTNNIANIGNNNLSLIASCPIANQNPAVVFYVQNPSVTNGGLGNQQAGYINNGGMTLNSTCPLIANGGVRIIGACAPSFSAFGCSDTNLNTTPVLVNWVNTEWNIGGFWSANTFTCPSTAPGIYQVIIALAPSNTNCIITADIRISGNSTRLFTGLLNSNFYGSSLIRVNSGDTVRLWVSLSTGPQGLNNAVGINGNPFHSYFQMSWVRPSV